jgi:hypothetical protein
MANAVGSEELESKTNVPEEIETYQIISFNAKDLPETYKNVVVAPFLNSLRYGNDLFKLIDKDVYYSTYAKYIELLLSRPKSVVKLAMLDDDTILGWSLFEAKILHYVWIKKEQRRLGIAKSLLPKEFDTISHITNKGLSIWVSKYPSLKFNPFI